MTDRIVTIDGVAHALSIAREGGAWRSDGAEIVVLEVRDGEALVTIGERNVVVPFHTDGAWISLALDGEIYFAEVAEKGSRSRTRHREHSMSAPMPGLVLKVLAQAGAAVAKGMPLLILEAMKMEHTIVAPRDGRVAAVHCKEGEMVQPGVELVELEE